ncbi:hypothetical protein GBAR_LOCUS8379 [Geodia barretti]|uniref:Uncharacterized protein n=1 Tax=Geodia barretti TaxID=519541 RepID=A0AA35WA93_GEOBA|nr:hypothetical protein GBAR_LOCUS8379 [Geodia barretti]
MAVRTPSPFDSPPVSPLSPRGPPRREILFESYMQKTPPLEKIFVSWRKRYFVLSRSDPVSKPHLKKHTHPTFLYPCTLLLRFGMVNSAWVKMQENVTLISIHIPFHSWPHPW